MPFYTGTANSFADLRTALFNACVTEGWTLTGEILTKGTAAVKVEVNTVSTANKGIGLLLQGGTSISGSALVNPSPTTPRFGPPQTGATQPSWPMEYKIHINNSPDEIYFIAKFNVDFYYWLAFGLSDVPGLAATGMWLSAICNANAGGGAGSISCTTTGGGGSALSTGCIFWDTSQATVASAHLSQDAIASGLDSVVWAGNPLFAGQTAKHAVSAILASETLLSVQPNTWNSEAPLNRIQVFQWRDADKCSLVADLKNARYVRVDNYSPGQIINLGGDSWMIYPFYRKNTTTRNGGSGIEHTGTFGWAIRYDGP